MFLKNAVMAVAVILFIPLVHGAPRKTSTKAVSTVIAPSPLSEPRKKTIYTASFQASSGSIIARDTAYAGYVTNFLTLQPGLSVSWPDHWQCHLSLPFTWLTDQSDQQDRAIGRPEARIAKVFKTEERVRVLGSFAFKPPLYDTSFGKAELYRSWELAPGSGVEVAFKNAFRFFANGSLAYNTDTKLTKGVKNETMTSSLVDHIVIHPLILRTSTGVVHEIEPFTLTGAFDTAHSVSPGYEKLSSNAPGSEREQNEIKPLKVWLMKFSGSYKVDENLRLNGGVSKSLRSEFDSTRPVAIASDRFPEIADLTFNLGITQTF